MHVEHWGTGIDFYVATPLYVVSNLYKRQEGSLFAPLPEVFVRGVMCQLGKTTKQCTFCLHVSELTVFIALGKGKFMSVGHGYWFHGVLGFLSSLNPLAPARRLSSIKVRSGESDAFAATMTDFCDRLGKQGEMGGKTGQIEISTGIVEYIFYILVGCVAA